MTRVPVLRLAGLHLTPQVRRSAPPRLPATATQLSRRVLDAGRLEISCWQLPGAGRYRVYSSDAGTFDLDARKGKVHCHLLSGARRVAWEETLRGPVCSFYLLDRGFEPLHAGAVVHRGRAMALVGAPGAGKSSLTAWLARQCGGFLSDDVLPLKKAGRRVLAFTGLPHLRLTPPSVRPLGWSAAGTVSRAEKISVPIHARLRPGGHPLARVYLLERCAPRRRAAIAIETVSPREAFLCLAGNTLNAVLRTPVRMERQLRVFGWVANHVAVRRLSYPSGFEHLPGVWEVIQRDLSS